MNQQNDHPGIRIPPPAIVGICIALAFGLQAILPLNNRFFAGSVAVGIGIVLLLIAALIMVPALARFRRSHNTVITIKPARSLEMAGIYTRSRNPMYVALVLSYIGIAFLLGNWWHFLLLPLLVIVFNRYVIKREERYLERAFGAAYLQYKTNTPRWLDLRSFRMR